jgi:hypothetical protein
MRITIRRITMTQIDIDLNTGYSSTPTLFRRATGTSIALRMGFAVLALYIVGFLLTKLGTLLTTLAPVVGIAGGIFCAVIGLIWVFRWLQARIEEWSEWWIHLWEGTSPVLQVALIPIRSTRLHEKHRFLV